LYPVLKEFTELARHSVFKGLKIYPGGQTQFNSPPPPPPPPPGLPSGCGAKVGLQTQDVLESDPNAPAVPEYIGQGRHVVPSQ